MTVTSGGGGTLSGLTIGTATYGAGASGWLGRPTLSGTTAPATVTLAPNIKGRDAGSCTGTLPVTSSAVRVTNRSQPSGVTLTITVSPTVLPIVSLKRGSAGAGAVGSLRSENTSLVCTKTCRGAQIANPRAAQVAAGTTATLRAFRSSGLTCIARSRGTPRPSSPNLEPFRSPDAVQCTFVFKRATTVNVSFFR